MLGHPSYWLACTVLVQAVSAQPVTPQIKTIANAASYADSVSSGSLVTLTGQNLAAATCLAQDGLFPDDLCGVQVEVNGGRIPLLFVSSGQINAALPYVTGPARLKVVNNGAASAEFNTEIKPAAPGIFFQSNLYAAALLGDYSILQPTYTARTNGAKSILQLYELVEK